MNQFTTVVLVCGLLNFSQANSDPRYREVSGLYYIGVIALNFIVHLSTIIFSSLNNLKLLCKRRMVRMSAKEAFKEATRSRP